MPEGYLKKLNFRKNNYTFLLNTGMNFLYKKGKKGESGHPSISFSMMSAMIGS
jgi:hypothetical protein